MDTIFALATARGRAGIAVVRLSGPLAGAVLGALVGRLPPPRRAVLAALRAPDGELIDRGLVLWFPAPGSFTGEDVAELHLHGGPAVVQAAIDAIGQRPGLRPAEPGEFTRRAFQNGKLDLTAAEGLADLVAAETAAQRRQALRQLDGALGRLIEGWRARLIRGLAHLEAEIDFADEDLAGGGWLVLRPDFEGLAGELAAHLADARRGERLRDGLQVAILGPPNVGKSSLLNALARRDAAIVAASAGTTRDVVEVHLDLAGLAVTVADTAGLRASADPVEAEGVRRARARAAAADLKIILLDATTWPRVPDPVAAEIDARSLVVINKIDLRPLAEPLDVGGHPATTLSVVSGAGLDSFIARLAGWATDLADRAGPAPLTRARHRAAVAEAAAAVRRALGGSEIELVAEDLRLAGRALGRITGRVDVEDILDVVFSEFCIGK